MHARLLPVLLAILTVSSAVAQAPAPPANADRPWPVRLGARVDICQQNRPVVSRVVLVPDADTWLVEVSRWSFDGEWPVLFESDPHAAAFIRGFRPEEVVRVPATERRLPADPDQRKVRMLQAIRASWGARPDQPVVERFAELRWEPPGFAVASPRDPAWPAAVAIAAARGVPLVFIEDDLGPVNGVMNATVLAGLEARLRDAAAKVAADASEAVRAAIAAANPDVVQSERAYGWSGLGDLLDAVAICRAMPGRVRFTPPAGATVPKVRPTDAVDGPFATTDALCRGDDGERWGYAGWIWGDEARAANMAMSSIFLDRRNLWFVSGYEKGGAWADFAVEACAGWAAERGYAALYFDDEQADRESWDKLLRGGIPADVLFLNSHGNAPEFHLFDNAKVRPTHVPFTDHPMAVSMVHSFALQRPDDVDTVGGRFLGHGVYASIGSVDEPYLAAFVPPALQVRRLAAGVPFLLAGRMWPGESNMSGVWKITTIGDPFMLAQPPEFRKVRIVPLEEAPPIPGAESVQDVARAKIRSLLNDRSVAAELIRLLELGGQDEVAIEVWMRIIGTGDQAAIVSAARSILGPLFRTGRPIEFVYAYERLPREARDRDAADMLWHLMTPRLTAVHDPDTIMLLEREVREPFAFEDLQALVPHIDRVLGDGRGTAAVQRRIDREPNPARKAQLRRLLSP